jgi:HD-GYP domain-containing protein (c-di-GMP phosphodiesterase class II)
MNSYLEANLKNVLQNAGLQYNEKAEVMHDATAYIIREMLVEPGSVEQVRQSERVVESAVEFILSNRSILGHLIRLTAKDYQTHLHCVEVMTYAIALGKRMGVKDGQELIDLGQSALLHDIGKAFVNPRITLKKGPLDEQEFTEMKRHPNFGYLTLQSTGVPSRRVLHVVRYHHEDLVGKGYPRGISPSEIGLDARIVTCADIFSALTKDRTYRKAYKPFPALKLMKEWTDSKVDPHVFREFVLLLGNVRY